MPFLECPLALSIPTNSGAVSESSMTSFRKHCLLYLWSHFYDHHRATEQLMNQLLGPIPELCVVPPFSWKTEEALELPLDFCLEPFSKHC